MSDDYKSRQRSMYSEADKQQQKDELAKAYDRRRAPLKKEQAELKSQLSHEREELRQARERHDRDPQAVSRGELDRRESDIQKLETKSNGNQQKLTELDRRQRLGNESIDSTTVTEGPTGEVTINAKVGPAQERLDYQNENRSGLESRGDVDRLHSRGSGTGLESDCGITYGPKEVNHQLQNHGVEEFVREVHDQKRDGNEVWLKTVTSTHEGTRDLKEIQYEISARPEGSQAKPEPLYRATINVDKNGKSWVSDGWQSPRAESYLKETPSQADSMAKRAETSAHQRHSGKETSQKSLGGAFGGSESSKAQRYGCGDKVAKQRRDTTKTLSSSEAEKNSTTRKKTQRTS